MRERRVIDGKCKKREGCGKKGRYGWVGTYRVKDCREVRKQLVF